MEAAVAELDSKDPQNIKIDEASSILAENKNPHATQEKQRPKT